MRFKPRTDIERICETLQAYKRIYDIPNTSSNEFHYNISAKGINEMMMIIMKIILCIIIKKLNTMRATLKERD